MDIKAISKADGEGLGEDENGEDVGSEKEWTSLIPWVI
jgi:hypothetical protein